MNIINIYYHIVPGIKLVYIICMYIIIYIMYTLGEYIDYGRGILQFTQKQME